MIDESRGWPELSEQNLLALMDGHLPPTGNEQAEAYFNVLRERVQRSLIANGVDESWLGEAELLGVYAGVFDDLHRQVCTIIHRREIAKLEQAA